MINSGRNGNFGAFALVALFAAGAAMVAHDLHRPSVVFATSTDTPIKVSGGAMTFFSFNNWVSTNSGGFCISILKSDLKLVALDHYVFEDDGSQPANIASITSPNWRLFFYGHDANEDSRHGSKASSDGVEMTASGSLDCQNQPIQAGNRMGSLTIHVASPAPASEFYATDLVANGFYNSNKRFRSNCGREQVDRCERVAELDVYLAGNATTTADATYTCADGDCALHVGAAMSETIHRHTAAIHKDAKHH